MANTIKLKHGFNIPTFYHYILYSDSRKQTEPSSWAEDRDELYKYDENINMHVALSSDETYDSTIDYYWVEKGFVSFYELMYPTNDGGGRLYINDDGNLVQLGRKIFVQSSEPIEECIEGDLWVNTDSLS